MRFTQQKTEEAQEQMELILKRVVCKELLIELRFKNHKFATLGRTPLQWKMSAIIPLFKKGDPLNSEKCRPIENLNSLGKNL